ncbi:MAG TPA: glycerate kinase [Polyangiaceae bacterium]|jgi:glycerate kinase
MRVVVAPNALKGSLTAPEAARAIARGVLRAAPTATVLELPIADGGDGTSDILIAACSGSTRVNSVRDALGRPVRASWGVIGAPLLGVIDVASASGLARLAPAERNPWLTSSYGTGELLCAALDAGCSRILLGVGGSATVDGGLGILAALGFALLDPRGAPVAPAGRGLAELAQIGASHVHPALARTAIEIACDVENPLLGANGAARVFAPQKGANPEQVLALEAGLSRLSEVIERYSGRDVRALRFGGAAGGIAAGLAGVLGATLCSGIDRVLDRVGFENALDGADFVITAEGRFDAQSSWNKGPIGVARRARSRGVPTLLLAGSIESGLEPGAFRELWGARAIAEGLDAATAFTRAGELLEQAAARATTEFLASTAVT